MNDLVAVTGSRGFIGREVVAELRRRGRPVRPLVRAGATGDEFAAGDMDEATDWRPGLQGVGCVVHAAARVHVMRDEASDPLAAFRLVNVAGTRRLAEQAAAAGVRRFVFLSTLKVNGETTPAGRPFTAHDQPAPSDAYGLSKWEAESALAEVSRQSGLEVVVVRPPLVYGPGAKGNFARLLGWVRQGVPLPFASVANQRSLVALGNLVDLLVATLDHPGAAGQTFLVSDGHDLSTPELIRRLAAAMHRSARLLPCPPVLLRAGARLAGRGAEVERLVGSLQADISRTRQILDWTPPVNVDEGLGRAIAP